MKLPVTRQHKDYLQFYERDNYEIVRKYAEGKYLSSIALNELAEQICQSHGHRLSGIMEVIQFKTSKED